MLNCNRFYEKENYLINYNFFILIVLSSILMFNAKEEKPLGLFYEISGCDIKEDIPQTFTLPPIDKPSLNIDGNNLTIIHSFNYVCCANITLNWSIYDNLIKIYEYNTGEMCFCLCDYEIRASLSPLKKGTYNVEIYGVGHDSIDGKLINKKVINIK